MTRGLRSTRARTTSRTTSSHWLGPTLVLAAMLTFALSSTLAHAQGTADGPEGDGDATTTTVEVGSASLELPGNWSFEELAPMVMGAMDVEIGYAASPDNRVQVLVAVIDPFGVDLQDWDQADLLGPLVLDVVRSSGYESDNFRVRRVSCEMNGTRSSGRLVIFPKSRRGRKRLISGLTCGYRDSSRWAIAAVLVDSFYDRPLLLEQYVDEAAAFVESFRFPD